MSDSKLANDQTRSLVRDTGTPGPRVLVFWDGGSASHRLDPGATVVIGRGDDSDVQVLDTSVSRRHVEVKLGPPLTVRDLGSAHGTVVRGARLGTNATATLGYGETVQVGGAILVVQPGPEGVPAEAAPSAGATAAPMAQVRQLVHLVAPTGLSVLLLGETGVGKEVTAAAIHRESRRSGGPFVRVNCAALTESLLESELFGHERGAFTGAHTQKEGLLEAAHGGTMFLDEVGELTLALQSKLLRVLEDGEVRRVGATRGRSVDVRFVAATNRELPAYVQTGSFRSDLYFRLNGMTLRIPPLRERLTELPALVATLLPAAFARAQVPAHPLAQDVLDRLMRYVWPGNVRELRNVLERAVVLAGGGPIRQEHLVFEDLPSSPSMPAPAAPLTSPPPAHPFAPPPNDLGRSEGEQLPQQIERLERARIEQALLQTGGNQTLAAQLLGITRRQLISRLETYGLPRPRKK